MQRRPTPDVIVGLIDDATDLAELESSLFRHGISYRSRRRLHRFLERNWAKAHSSVRDALLSGSADAEPEWVEVHKEGVTYRLLGVAHGQRSVARLSTEVRDLLNEILEAAGSSGPVATERAIARLLGLPKSMELDYAADVVRRVGVTGMLKQAVLILVALPLLPLVVLCWGVARHSDGRIIRDALKDPKAMGKVLPMWRAGHLPPRIEAWFHPDMFRLVHSEAMAAAAVRRACELGADRLHVLMGAAHVDEVAWFLGRDVPPGAPRTPPSSCS